MTTPDDKEHDKLLCERLATTVDHGICKCAERHRIAELEAALAAERERREAAEGILRNIRNRGVGGWVTSAIDDHFARYEKEPT